eukprot:scaffold23458_cov48-Phaeocystis_antarctica.AAC.1
MAGDVRGASTAVSQLISAAEGTRGAALVDITMTNPSPNPSPSPNSNPNPNPDPNPGRHHNDHHDLG